MKKAKNGHFITYILKCSDGALYAGYTNDLEKRIKTHNLGKGSKCLRGRLPVKLAWHQDYKYLRCAMKKEAAIKRLKKKQKEKLILKYEKCNKDFF